MKDDFTYDKSTEHTEISRTQQIKIGRKLLQLSTKMKCSNAKQKKKLEIQFAIDRSIVGNEIKIRLYIVSFPTTHYLMMPSQ
ncbi:unnamed protein product [Rhizophagus irregularis]|nr:unnamed protein product [Rhizophagus irregularis]